LKRRNLHRVLSFLAVLCQELSNCPQFNDWDIRQSTFSQRNRNDPDPVEGKVARLTIRSLILQALSLSEEYFLHRDEKVCHKVQV
jgi:hypothetical protein